MLSYKLLKAKDSVLLKQILSALRSIQESELGQEINPHITFSAGADYTLRVGDQFPEHLERILALDGCTIRSFAFYSQKSGHIATVRREHKSPLDVIETPDNLFHDFPAGNRHLAQAIVISALENAFHVTEYNIQVQGLNDTQWGEYRKLQLETLNRLEQANLTIAENFTRRTNELEKSREEKFAAMERQLKAKAEEERAQLVEEFAAKNKALSQREEQLEASWKKYNTEQAGLEARAQIRSQIEDLKTTLSDGWHITKGTQAKRWPVHAAHGLLIGCTGVYAWFNGLSAINKFVTIAANDYLGMGMVTLKGFLPFALLVSFIIYYLRWTNDWAKLHADEEFKMRARVIDINRAGWLLETIRDANAQGRTIPDNLLKELAGNLFNNTTSTGGTTPLLAHEIIKSLVVDMPNGTKVDLRTK